MGTDDGVTGRVWSFRDVTDRRRAEEGLRSAEERYRRLVEQMCVVTSINSPTGVADIEYISPQIGDLTGYPAERWTQDADLWASILHPEDRDREVAASLRHHETGDPYLGEYRITTRDGRIRWIREEARLILDEAGRPTCQGIMFDITDRKHADEALQLALTTERHAAEELRAVDEMKNMFLNAVSHELRTPLTTILGNALTLERGGLAEEDAHDLTRRLASNARKLDSLLADLLDLDRLRRGLLEVQLRPTDVGELVRSVVEQVELIGGRAVQVDAPSIVIPIESAKVQRIVENLLANAVRHTPAGTPLWVRVAPVGDGVVIAVEDAGPGVPQELRSAMFEPFAQGSTNGHHSPGVGIGLSLVASFAELHSGRAWVEERPGGGASFRVFLPDHPSVARSASA